MSFAVGVPGEAVRMFCSRHVSAERNQKPGEVIVETNREGLARISDDGLRVIFEGEPA